VTPGQFQSSADGSRVFFIERDSEDGRTGRNVFILAANGATESVTTAKTGRIEIEGDERFLLLNTGQRNELNRDTREKTLSRFESYKVAAGERVMQSTDNVPPKARTSLELLRTPTAVAQGELVWRMGLVFGGANLLLLAIGLAEINPRRASNWNLLFALLSFVVYYNLINLSQAWVAGGKLGMGAALAGPHGGAFLLALGLLWWRDNGNRLPSWRRLAGSPQPA
jgi:lipopolysaccharide export system permease protein